MNLGNMTFDNGILHLANWLGNVIMPTIAAAFIIIAILQFSKGQEFSHSMYGALACLLVSGLTRAFETFASQAAWNNPDLYWISITDPDRLGRECDFAGLRSVPGRGNGAAIGNLLTGSSHQRLAAPLCNGGSVPHGFRPASSG